MAGGFQIAGDAVTVTLSGEAVSAVSASVATAQLKIDDDGKVYKQSNGGGWTQIDAVADWVRPISAAPGLYEVRFTNLTGAALDSATALEDVWHSLSSSDFVMTQSRGASGTDGSTFDVEIRENGGSVLASASYTLSATVV